MKGWGYTFGGGGVNIAYGSLLIICTCLVLLVSKSFMRRLGMQKGVIKVAVEFCAERTEAEQEEKVNMSL